VLAPGDRQLELGADSVGRGDEDGIAITCGLRIEEGAEAAESSGRPAARGCARQRLDRLDQRIAGIDVDPGGFVGEAVYGVLPGDAL
jgi:hypothetical protein